MSYSDFLGMDSDDFAAVARAYNRMEENRERRAWERARLVAWVSALPYLKDASATPQRFLPFSWEKDREKDGKNGADGGRLPGSAERRARAEAARRKMGERY